MKLKLDDIQIDGGTQPRVDIDESVVSEYAEAMREGDEFPPIIVFSDGAEKWIADGFHRYFASDYLGFLEIEAEVKSGTRRDAVLYSVSANSKHGLRRSNADKRKAVLTLLKDEEWSQWSDREIARRCEVSNRMVSNYMDELSVNGSQMERKVKRGDQEYTVDTTNIGKRDIFGKEVNGRKEGKLDNPSDYEVEYDPGYDLSDNVDPDTGEVFEEEKREPVNGEKRRSRSRVPGKATGTRSYQGFGRLVQDV